jgi:hypothetical protein
MHCLHAMKQGGAVRKLFVAVVFVHVLSIAAIAQSEGDLKRHFEGRKVTILIDMPATKDGVDIYPERSQPMDFSDYARCIKQFGVAVEEGDRLMITKVRVKEKHVEFQLGGGGYGTFGDETSPSVGGGPVGKSRKEKRLEDEIKRETDEARRRTMREDLDDLRRDRHREDRRLAAERATAVELGKQRIEQRRLDGGSRFNIRFETTPSTSQLTPEAIMKALSEYVEFP